MEAKLKIDLDQGLLEVEGTEKFVNEIYLDFKSNILTKLHNRKTNKVADQKSTPTEKKAKPRKRTSSLTIKTPSIVKDLDLMGKGKGPSLKDFIKRYSPSSNMEWNIVFIYYLKKLLEISDVGVDHVYTCYKNAGIKIPKNLYQSLIDTANRKGFINTESIDSISVPIAGENFIEHELAKNEQET